MGGWCGPGRLSTAPRQADTLSRDARGLSGRPATLVLLGSRPRAWRRSQGREDVQPSRSRRAAPRLTLQALTWQMTPAEGARLRLDQLKVSELGRLTVLALTGVHLRRSVMAQERAANRSRVWGAPGGTRDRHLASRPGPAAAAGDQARGPGWTPRRRQDGQLYGGGGDPWVMDTKAAQQANAALHHAQTVDAAAVNHALRRPLGAQGQRAGSGCWGDRQALRRTLCRAWAERRSAGTGLPTWPPQDALLPGVPWFSRGRPLLQSWSVWFSLR